MHISTLLCRTIGIEAARFGGEAIAQDIMRLCTFVGRTKIPQPGGHSKYRRPLAEPSFLPSAESSSTPTNKPSVFSTSPKYRTTPGTSTPSTAHRSPTARADAALCSSASFSRFLRSCLSARTESVRLAFSSSLSTRFSTVALSVLARVLCRG
eukprot:TRINITY_DN5091_c0_g1_i1.p2 TRINITY_DN5091_c0_g1~~TRINITY_DN5091_c0_g1_i1.p2  ORF type:complete len:153 (+),score=9.50 TRINITY_DN5091_c0_g1_i1:161-619(+)